MTEREQHHRCPRCGQRFLMVYADDPAAPHAQVRIGCPTCGEGIAVDFPAEHAAIVSFTCRIQRIA